MIRLISNICFLLCTTIVTLAQSGPAAYYGFNQCDLLDETIMNGDAAYSATLDCDCGVRDSSLVFTGSEALVFPNEVRDLLTGDYSISFYFQAENTQPFVDLLSIRDNCNQDSVLSIKYITVTDEVEILISQSNADLSRFRGAINPNYCWHHVVLVKSGLIATLYLDDSFVDDFSLPFDVVYSKLANLSVSNSPCLGISEDRLIGKLDEFKIFDRALSFSEIAGNYLFPDQIITNDTTIFIGDTLTIDLGKTCTPMVDWSPASDIDDSDDINPVVYPESSTVYQAFFDLGNCTTMDEIRVNVLDLENLQCDSLLLPNAFTPNNDGLNDGFGIDNTFIIEDLESFEIIDRWGGKVFQAANKNELWNGSFDGQPCNPGMYLYKISYTCQGETYNSVGNFSLIR